jgi:hypothetical protein
MPSCARSSIPADPAWRRLLAAVVLLCLGGLCNVVRADTVYLAPDAFLRETFAGKPPKAQYLWLDDAAQTKLKAIFGHPYPQARLHYWRADGKTAWILEAIGKEQPITAGFVVKAGSIDRARLLIYRESRGDEIRYPSFLNQFHGAQLQDDSLSAGIDGISGATLSVNAMKRMARAALVLDALAQ